MSRIIAGTSFLIALFSFLAICPSVSAQTVIIPHTDRGWYSPTGTRIPDNYIVGDNRGENPLGFTDHRNYFVFDLAGVTQPIASAKLALFVPSTATRPGPGFDSSDPSENYELHDVVTSLASLIGGTAGVAAYTDLGSGVVYGSRAMTAADQESVIEINLNSVAISALDAATGLIAIGGSLTTLDGLANNEYVFGWSDYLPNVQDISELRLTLVPEPSALAQFGVLVLLMSAKRRFKRR
jgi:hypothetical protein